MRTKRKFEKGDLVYSKGFEGLGIVLRSSRRLIEVTYGIGNVIAPPFYTKTLTLISKGDFK